MEIGIEVVLRCNHIMLQNMRSCGRRRRGTKAVPRRDHSMLQNVGSLPNDIHLQEEIIQGSGTEAAPRQVSAKRGILRVVPTRQDPRMLQNVGSCMRWRQRRWQDHTTLQNVGSCGSRYRAGPRNNAKRGIVSQRLTLSRRNILEANAKPRRE